MSGISIQTAAKVIPQCYAYTTPGVPVHDGWTKIGFTERDVETRIKEQTHTVGVLHKTWWHLRAAFMSEPFGTFTDKDFHAYLKKLGVPRENGKEWFQIDPNVAKAKFLDYTQNHGVLSAIEADAAIPYVLRSEQNDAVERTLDYFYTHKNGEFLWNAKPRFGKTLSAYDLCMRLGAKNILIVTNRPAIANSWYSDYETFFGPQSGYLFVSNVDGIKDRKYVLSRQQYMDRLDGLVKGCIEFVSLQDLKGSIYFGGQHDKLVEISAEDGIEWDILIVDEAHEGVDTYKTDTAFNHIMRKWTLHLSGTPFKALANDKFPSDAIFNWTYADEQRKKRNWNTDSEIENPYEILPRLNLFTYQMSDIIRDKVKRGIELADKGEQEYAFDLNEFFKTNESGSFIHDEAVNKFVDALVQQERFPFSTPELRNELKHTFWLLNRVASAKALAKKLRIHPVFKTYEIIVAAGDGKLDDDDENEKAFDRVTSAIKIHDKTITLSVGQLTTGVTIPEWTAVLMLSNMASPSLYMQAAFRAQNPCLFQSGDDSYRKKNAYVFDFDPARTLLIFEKFANDLIPETSGDKGDSDQRKLHVRELLNFFPVYGEDSEGAMVELDAEAVLTIPRHIHAREVVERGFMSNFLFANISGIFNAPKEIIDLINGMEAIEEPKALNPVEVDENTANDLGINENGDVEVSREYVIGISEGLFGDKVYDDIAEKLDEAVIDITSRNEKEKNSWKNQLNELKTRFSRPIADTLMQTAQQQYKHSFKKSTQSQLKHKIQEATDAVVNAEYGDYTIRDRKLVKECKEEVSTAQSSGASLSEISKLNDEYEQRRAQNYENMIHAIREGLNNNNLIEVAAKTIVETVETERLNDKKDSIEDDVRNHLRGFSRTIPAFLMAYGDEDTTLANFDLLVPADVFWEVTVNPQNGEGVTLEQFRMLRDGGDYYQKDKNGKEIRSEEAKRHFDGHFFDEVVFNDAVLEFMRKREELADYFNQTGNSNIFDYIPPQRSNQIFTPKLVVKDMIDRLEEENPGCFDNPDARFADLYMKSGMYIAEIVTRLYQSKTLKVLYPNDQKRLRHIFEKQVFGCAPTEVIYHICLRFILGFSDKIQIDKHNIKLCDTLKYVKDGTLAAKINELFQS